GLHPTYLLLLGCTQPTYCCWVAPNLLIAVGLHTTYLLLLGCTQPTYCCWVTPNLLIATTSLRGFTPLVSIPINQLSDIPPTS
ncbi:MAG: hypothetical protein KFF72_18765, partial [Arthrospira sp. SH-MAG29]|nr:hypothetical protein [Arthrospira sp. SH-MAG29]